MTYIKDQSLHRELYKDKEFPPDHTSLFGSAGVVEGCHGCFYIATWMRPKDITNKAWGCRQNCSHFVIQGAIGNCYLIAAVACIRKTKYYAMVMPKKFDFHSSDYDGSFTFRFWSPEKNDWVEIKIDDYLPVCRLQLFFGRADDPNDFSIPLLEKAYTKFLKIYIKCSDREIDNRLSKKCYDSYKSLDGGYMAEVLLHLTGRPSTNVKITNITKNRHHFTDYLIDCFERGYLMGCSMYRNKDIPNYEPITNEGLVKNHSYTIVDVVKKPTPLVKLLNPWGNNTATWKGRYGQGTREWDELPENVKESCHHSKGEFLMPIDDMARNFTSLVVCSTEEVLPSTTNSKETNPGVNCLFDAIGISLIVLIVSLIVLYLAHVVMSRYVNRDDNYANPISVGKKFRIPKK